MSDEVFASKSFVRFFKDEKVISVGRYPSIKVEAGIVKLANGFYQVLVLRDDEPKVTIWNLILQTKSHNKAQDTLQTVDNVLILLEGCCYSVWNSYEKKWTPENEIIHPSTTTKK